VQLERLVGTVRSGEKDVRTLAQEREVLKKAAAFFARESETRWVTSPSVV
jgi:hypothetical protein